MALTKATQFLGVMQQTLEVIQNTSKALDGVQVTAAYVATLPNSAC